MLVKLWFIISCHILKILSIIMESLNGCSRKSSVALHLIWRLPIGRNPALPYLHSLVGGTYACHVELFEISHATFGPVVMDGFE